MGCIINQTTATAEQLAQWQSTQREQTEKINAERRMQEEARLVEDRILKERAQTPPPGMSVNYYSDLWALTAPAATNDSSIPHPELPGITSGGLHASPGLELKDRAWAADQNAQQPPGWIPPYHEQAPVVVYRTEIDADGMVRLHHDENKVREWSTRAPDVDHGHIDAEEATRRLSLPPNQPGPTHISDVSPSIGSTVEASRPVSGEVRQFNIKQRIASWFSNTRPLG